MIDFTGKKPTPIAPTQAKEKFIDTGTDQSINRAQASVKQSGLKAISSGIGVLSNLQKQRQ